MPDHRLKVIPGGGKPKAWRPRKASDPELIVCPQCNSTKTIKVRVGGYWKDGKPVRGTYRTECRRCETDLGPA